MNSKIIAGGFSLLVGAVGCKTKQGQDVEQGQGTGKKLNVLYLCIEDMPPTLGCYGDTIVHTPNIDNFAKQSVLFEDTHCQVALCTPSRISLLTGVRPTTSGMVKIDDDWDTFLPGATTLPRHFKDNGYHTVNIGKIFDGRSGPIDTAFHHKDFNRLADNSRVLPKMKEVVSSDQPFLFMVGYSQVHTPYTPTECAKRIYSVDQMDMTGREMNHKGDELNIEKGKELLRDYYAYVTDVDSLIGEVLDTARSLGLFENTIILVGAFDHGYSLGYHGKWGKGDVYDKETHVPMMVYLPGNENNGKRTAALTELVDIYPTLVDLCGLPQPEQKLEGLSVKPLLDQPAREWKKAIFSVRAYHPGTIGVRTSDYLFVRNQDNGPLELYDRKKDPINLHDISGENPAIVAEMQKLLQGGWEEALPE